MHFDHCGHRFATAALDGTVCTWQLEVGGRSNVRPTESSLCFNNNASYVFYPTEFCSQVWLKLIILVPIWECIKHDPIVNGLALQLLSFFFDVCAFFLW